MKGVGKEIYPVTELPTTRKLPENVEMILFVAAIAG